jgi:8-oxo-dGTP pyrophosphatase MutT (NUDIX family)
MRANPSSRLVESVSAVDRCVLAVRGDAWPFAKSHAEAIEASWQEATRANPRYFNGVVHLIDDVSLERGALNASLVRTDFKSYLYWREQGFPEAGVLDGFGSALIRSSDDHVILGRQRAGNVNSGLAYLPSGFIDAQDVEADGSIDIVASVVREIAEETGAGGELLSRDAGFLVTRSGPQLSLAVPFRVAMTTEELIRFVERKIATHDSELEAIIPVAGLGDIEDLPMPRYARVLLEALFATS